MALDDETFSDWASETTQLAIKKNLEDKLKNYDAKKVEELLKKIEDNTKALKGQGTGGSGGASGIDFTKAVKALNLKGEGGGGGPVSGTASAAIISEGMKKAISTTPGGLGGGGGPKSGDGSKEKEIGAIKKTTVGLFGFGRSLTKSIIGVISFTAVIGALGRYVGSSVDAYRELLDTGQSFNGSILEMRKAAADAGMGFETFTKIMGTNSTILKSIGTQEFIALQKGVRQANKIFGQFGFTVEESAQAVVNMAEANVMAGIQDSLSREKQIAQTQQYMFQVSELSKLTGKSRKQMMEDMRQNIKNVDINTAAALLSEAGSKKFLEGMQKAGPMMTSLGSEANDALRDLAAQTVKFGNIGMSSFGRVAAIIGSDFVEGAEGWVAALKRGEAGGQDLGKMFKALADPKNMEGVARMSLAGDEGAKSVMALMTGFKTMDKEMKEKLLKTMGLTEKQFLDQMAAAKDRAEKENKGTEALLNMQDRMRSAMGKIQSVMLNALEPTISLLGDKFEDFMKIFDKDSTIFDESFKKLKEAFDNLIKSIFGIDNDMKDFDIKGTIEGIINGLTTFINYIIDPVIPIFKMLVDNIGWIIGGLVALKIISVFATIMSAFGGLSAIIGGIGTVLSIAGTAIASVLAAVSLPVWGIIAAFVAAGAAIYYFWDEIKEFGSWIISLPGKLLDGIVDAISSVNLTEIFNKIFQPLFDFFSGLPGKLLELVTGVIPSVGDIGDKVAGWFGFGDNKLKAKTSSNTDARNITRTGIPNISVENIKQIQRDNTKFGQQQLESDARVAETVYNTATRIGDDELAKKQADILEKILVRLERAEVYAEEQVNQTKKLGRNRAVGMSEAN